MRQLVSQILVLLATYQPTELLSTDLYNVAVATSDTFSREKTLGIQSMNGKYNDVAPHGINNTVLGIA